MADEIQNQTTTTKPNFFAKLTSKQRTAGIIGAVVLAAAVTMSFLYGGKTEYKVLFSNVSDKDGGQIVAALEKMQVPHEIGGGGSVILVPAERVHDVRLKLAGDGLPKGGNVGFELMEKQKFGISNFAEHVNYQRALEGELAQTIGSIQYVDGARVHLSIPKQSVFVREALKPTASVVVNLQTGRSLDRAQISGIANLIAAAVPGMDSKGVTILDQNGSPLTSQNDPDEIAVDGRHLAYQRRIEADYAKEIEAMLEPIVGKGGVRTKVRAEIDLTKVEMTEELFGPNMDPNKAAVRSSQVNESVAGSANQLGGVPGAVSNVPPGTASAPPQLPVGVDGKPALPPLPPLVSSGPSSKSNTTNYEVDRTIRKTNRATGAVARVSVAVLLNNKIVTDAQGKPKSVPLTEAELARATKLVQDVVGYREARGDSVEVANLEFMPEKIEIIDLPFWKDPEILNLISVVGKWLAFFIVLMYAIFGVVRPLLKKVLAEEPAPEAISQQSKEEDEEDGVRAEISLEAAALAEEVPSGIEDVRKRAAELAAQAPDVAAGVVKRWLDGEEKE